jgi:non-ribosomal peptide synthetase component E (peptide arylation enzyme)
MAEGLVNYTRLNDSPERIINTQGCPMCPDDEVWVADADGNPLPRGEVGRLMTAGHTPSAATTTARSITPKPLMPTVFTAPAI